MGQELSNSTRCCAQDTTERNIEQLRAVEELSVYHSADDKDSPQIPTTGASTNKSQLGDESFNWECCHVRGDVPVGAVGTAQYLDPSSKLESLSYLPVRFDEGSTADNERSHTRYAKLVLHSTRARTQRRSKAWEDWLRGATAGRPITLLLGLKTPRRPENPGDRSRSEEASSGECTKVAATYYLDRALTKVSISVTNEKTEPEVSSFMVDNIQVICPASDFMLFFDQVDAKLDESERARAVLIQYVTEDTERKRICILEATEDAKDKFVQSLTALWLEKRHEYSMWF